MRVWSRIDRLSRRLERARRQAYAAHGLEPWEFDVLAALRRSGEPYRLTPGRLLLETNVTSGTMTNRVRRLAERGLVERESHPVDGRGALVRLTRAGLDRVDAAITGLLEAEDEMLGRLDEPSRRRLAEALAELLDAQAEGTSAPPEPRR